MWRVAWAVGLVLSRQRQMLDCNGDLLAIFGATREQIIAALVRSPLPHGLPAVEQRERAVPHARPDRLVHAVARPDRAVGEADLPDARLLAGGDAAAVDLGGDACDGGVVDQHGFTNRNIRSRLTGTRWLRACADDPKNASAKVGRCFRRLHAHGLIAKIPRTRRWRVTDYGRKVMGTTMYLREHHFQNVYAAVVH